MLFDESAIKVVLSYEPGASKERYGSVTLMPSGKGRGSSLKCACTDAMNVEHVCDEIIDAINRAATNPQTRESDRFKFMGLVLDDQARVVWTQAATDVGVDVLNPTAGDFNRVVKKFFDKRTHTTKMRDNILRYLEMGIKKPRDWDPLKYESRFMKIKQNAEYFNGIKPAPTDEELKDWYLRSYPKAYRADYMKKGTSKSDDIAAITKHMTYLHAIDEATGLLKEPSTKKKVDDRKSNKTHRRYVKKGDDRRSSKSKSYYSKKKEVFEIPPHVHCPNHPKGSHTWGSCSLNPDNAKDGDDRKRDRDDRKRDNKTKGKKYSHSHHLAEEDDQSTASNTSEGEVSARSSGSDSDSSVERKSKRRAASHHINNEMEKLNVFEEAFEDE